MRADDPLFSDSFDRPNYKPMGLVATEPTAEQTSEFMIGDVSVAIILLESNGAIDPDTEDWSNEDPDHPGVDRVEMVVSKIQEGLDWWTEREPKAHLRWTYHTYIVPTSYEPITRHLSDEDLWVKEAMEYFGYTSGNRFDRVEAFDHDLRTSDGTDWAFTIFVVDSLNDEDGYFADIGWFAWAYNPGPYFMMNYRNANNYKDHMDYITAHETGHIFGARDQYASACPTDYFCTIRSGFLQVETQNCDRPACLSDVPSIMRFRLAAYNNGEVDPYGRGQVGWRDEDKDGILDAIDSDYNPEIDTDRDGIVDYWDYCPNRPGTPNLMGCPLRGGGGCGPGRGRGVACAMAW